MVGHDRRAKPGQALPEFIQLEGALSTDVAGPGEEITASSVDPCTVSEEGPGELVWLTFAADEDLSRSEDVVPVADDGHCEVTFTASDEVGEFVFLVVCVSPDVEPPPDEELEQLPADEAALSEALTEDGGEEPEVIELYELPVHRRGSTHHGSTDHGSESARGTTSGPGPSAAHFTG